jgi:hypothetical protein
MQSTTESVITTETGRRQILLATALIGETAFATIGAQAGEVDLASAECRSRTGKVQVFDFGDER